ncbi:MAG: STAS domain-containing protein [Gammaproteobacteria bacterium]|nr:STAS domain-containing protein [Gammaproteobacteria bacterium]
MAVITKEKLTERLIINGDLDFISVVKLQKQGCELIKKTEKVVFDLRQAVAKDSSALSLLLAWTRCAKRMEQSIQFINLPEQLQDMVKLTGLEQILPIGE